MIKISAKNNNVILLKLHVDELIKSDETRKVQGGKRGKEGLDFDWV